LLAREVELDLVHVDRGHVPGRPDETGELEGDAAAATSQVQTAHAGSHTDPLEELRGVRPARAVEDLQALVAFLPATDHVARQGGDHNGVSPA
jgi:hypothetical protein